jgi:hypothetical protein
MRHQFTKFNCLGKTVETSFTHGPGLLRSRWVRLLGRLGFMPRVAIICNPDENGQSLKVTYRVYYAFWMGNHHHRAFYGLPEIVETTAGDCLKSGRSWDRVACDRIEYDTRTGEGRVKTHPSNPSY